MHWLYCKSEGCLEHLHHPADLGRFCVITRRESARLCRGYQEVPGKLLLGHPCGRIECRLQHLLHGCIYGCGVTGLEEVGWS